MFNNIKDMQPRLIGLLKEGYSSLILEELSENWTSQHEPARKRFTQGLDPEEQPRSV